MTLDSLRPVVAATDVGLVTHLLRVILIAAVLGCMLVPVLIFLVVLCPPHMRTRPVYILNLVACAIGICEATLCIVLMFLSITGPDGSVHKALILTTLVFTLIPTVFIDSILFFRMLAFYPAMLTTRRRLLVIIAFPVLCKFARLGTLTGSIILYYRATSGLTHFDILIHSIWLPKPLFCISLILQMVDNSYVCLIFLYKLGRLKRRARAIGASKDVLHRIPAIFAIALGNYVFPVTMNIAQIALMATNPSFMNIMEIFLTNNFVTILGVVFATVWTNTENWRAGQAGPQSDESYMQEQEERVVPGLPVFLTPRSSSTFVVSVELEQPHAEVRVDGKDENGIVQLKDSEAGV
ncbi:hypothetical protein DENSPDRAFT_879377 [Dentipellis sp. KUC8613]|nr:hypothetical protein DENSPDRAFT_879377 [Dentipellis sp. KUC8613]